MENEKQVNVLTEEEVNKVEYDLQREFIYHSAFSLVASHRTLNSRNAKLVHENDELMAENVKLKLSMQTISELKYSNLSYHHEDAVCMNDIATKALEELNHE